MDAVLGPSSAMALGEVPLAATVGAHPSQKVVTLAALGTVD